MAYRRHFIVAAIAATIAANASAQTRGLPSAAKTDTTVSLRMEAPEKMMGQYPPQIRKYLLQNLRIGLTQPKTDMEARTKLVLHAVRIERGRVADTFASRAFSLPSGQDLIPGDMFLPGDRFIPGDMFMPGEMFSPGSTEYPASGQSGAVRENAQRFANSQRIADCSFLVILPVGVASKAQGVRF
jgi:hypothetical protein